MLMTSKSYQQRPEAIPAVPGSGTPEAGGPRGSNAPLRGDCVEGRSNVVPEAMACVCPLAVVLAARDPQHAEGP